MTFLGSRFWDSSDTSHGSHGSMTTRADAVFSFVSTRSGHFERQGWSGLVKAVFVIGALLLAYPMAMAQDVVELDQPSAGPDRGGSGGNGGNAGNPFSNRYVVTFSPGTDHSRRAEVARNAGVQVRHNFNLANALTVVVPNENTLNSLRNNRSVLSVSPEGVVWLFAKKPSAPSNLVATAVDPDVSLTWTDNAGGNTGGFEIQHCSGVGCGSFTQIALQTDPADTDYTHSGPPAPPAGSNSYRVRALNSGNGAPSQWSNTDTAVIGGGGGQPPGPPLPPPPNERGTSQQPPDGVIRVGLPTATSNGQGIGVAVVDTGIYFGHEDLDPAPDVPATEIQPGSIEGASANDLWGHGTHVAGRIAALDNNYGVVGVASHAKLYAVKVDATSGGAIATSDIVKGLEWIIAKGPSMTPPIKVVNISSGGLEALEDPAVVTMYHDRVIDLYNMGIVVVVSAGNDPNFEVSSLIPAKWPETITVAATIASDGLTICESTSQNPPPGSFWEFPVLADTATSFTTDGADVDISAPGAERTDLPSSCTVGFFYGTLSTTSPAYDPPTPSQVNGLYRRKIPSPGGWIEARGTSFAAPLVAGVAARILQANSGLDVEGVRLEIGNLADLPGVAPLNHPWAPSGAVIYTYDQTREGIAQAPQ